MTPAVSVRAEQLRARARLLALVVAMDVFLATWDEWLARLAGWSWAIVSLDSDPLAPAETIYGYVRREGEWVIVIALGGTPKLRFRVEDVTVHRTTVDEVERAWVAAGCPRPTCCHLPWSGGDGWCRVCGFERVEHRRWS